MCLAVYPCCFTVCVAVWSVFVSGCLSLLLHCVCGGVVCLCVWLSIPAASLCVWPCGLCVFDCLSLLLHCVCGGVVCLCLAVYPCCFTVCMAVWSVWLSIPAASLCVWRCGLSVFDCLSDIPAASLCVWRCGLSVFDCLSLLLHCVYGGVVCLCLTVYPCCFTVCMAVWSVCV